MKKIITQLVKPSGPMADYWIAYFDGCEESGPIAQNDSEMGAIFDLEQIQREIDAGRDAAQADDKRKLDREDAAIEKRG